MRNKRTQFLTALHKARRENRIKMLYRGVSLEMAYKIYDLNLEYNDIKQFADRLFYFGDKSRYFWKERIGSSTSPFEINETSDAAFKYIFYSFNDLIQNCQKRKTSIFFEKNSNAKQFFSEEGNLHIFLSKISNLSAKEKMFQRNYYLRLLHQLGETPYKESSLLVSSSLNKDQARKFSKNEILIYFWDFAFNNRDIINKGLPYFVGKPYKNQKEISVFSAIFPHYIFAFKFKNKMYYNPAIDSIEDFNATINSGFDINQEDFEKRLRSETNYDSYGVTDGFVHWDIKLNKE